MYGLIFLMHLMNQKLYCSIKADYDLIALMMRTMRMMRMMKNLLLMVLKESL
jgi:hypothetical protein